MAKTVTKQMKKRMQELRLQGMGYRRIAQVLTREFPETYSHMWVKRYFEEHNNELAQIIVENPDIREQLKEEILNTTEQLRMANEEAWRIYREAGSAAGKVKALQLVLDQLKFQNQLLMKLEKAANSITTINLIQIADQINEKLEDLEKKGYIKILDKGAFR